MGGKDHTDVAMSYNNIAVVYKSQNKYDEALEYYNISLDININKLGKDHTNVANSYYNIGDLYKNQSKYKEALECFNKSYNICKDKLGDDHQDTKGTLEMIQECKDELGM